MLAKQVNSKFIIRNNTNKSLEAEFQELDINLENKIPEIDGKSYLMLHFDGEWRKDWIIIEENDIFNERDIFRKYLKYQTKLENIQGYSPTDEKLLALKKINEKWDLIWERKDLFNYNFVNDNISVDHLEDWESLSISGRDNIFPLNANGNIDLIDIRLEDNNKYLLFDGFNGEWIDSDGNTHKKVKGKFDFITKGKNWNKQEYLDLNLKNKLTLSNNISVNVLDGDYIVYGIYDDGSGPTEGWMKGRNNWISNERAKEVSANFELMLNFPNDFDPTDNTDGKYLIESNGGVEGDSTLESRGDRNVIRRKLQDYSDYTGIDYNEKLEELDNYYNKPDEINKDETLIGAMPANTIEGKKMLTLGENDNLIYDFPIELRKKFNNNKKYISLTSSEGPLLKDEILSGQTSLDFKFGILSQYQNKIAFDTANGTNDKLVVLKSNENEIFEPSIEEEDLSNSNQSQSAAEEIANKYIDVIETDYTITDLADPTRYLEPPFEGAYLRIGLNSNSNFKDENGNQYTNKLYWGNPILSTWHTELDINNVNDALQKEEEFKDKVDELWEVQGQGNVLVYENGEYIFGNLPRNQKYKTIDDIIAEMNKKQEIILPTAASDNGYVLSQSGDNFVWIPAKPVPPEATSNPNSPINADNLIKKSEFNDYVDEKVQDKINTFKLPPGGSDNMILVYDSDSDAENEEDKYSWEEMPVYENLTEEDVEKFDLTKLGDKLPIAPSDDTYILGSGQGYFYRWYPTSIICL